MDIRPYLIVPKLIPQPTWGGDYIARYKSVVDPKIVSQKIGQSYELSADTMLSTVTDSANLPIEIGDPKTGETIEVIGDTSSIFPLQDLIDQDPQAVLGAKYVQQYGPHMQILIKFTQAKGNSFQVHVRPGGEIGHWKPKPESWYYFEPGRATLGLRTGVDLDAYKKVCFQIEAEMKRQSELVKQGQKNAESARKEIQDFLMTHSPFLFVNVVDVPKGAIIDLATGGIHHSWEEGDDIPEGNILYEVQVNVMDNDCTLRSFDKGKIADDGSIRPIHVDDYFNALDSDPTHNVVDSLIMQAEGDSIFATPYYTTKIGMSSTSDSFQHVFVQKDALQLGDLNVRKGASVFVPQYSVQTLEIRAEDILVTTLSG
jgi:hypothetical protein